MPIPTPPGAVVDWLGLYITDPADFNIVATEEDLIAAADDQNTITATRFEDLTPEEWDRVVSVLNDIIIAAEGELNGYAMSQNYLIPLSPLDDYAKNIVVKLAWISLRARRKVIDAEQAERERNQLQNGELRAISKGQLILSSLKGPGAGRGMDVYAVTSSERIMSRETLKGW